MALLAFAFYFEVVIGSMHEQTRIYGNATMGSYPLWDLHQAECLLKQLSSRTY